MIGILSSLGVLACLLGCGFTSAALALRRLDAGVAPPLGLSYRLYLFIPRAYGAAVSRRPPASSEASS